MPRLRAQPRPPLSISPQPRDARAPLHTNPSSSFVLSRAGQLLRPTHAHTRSMSLQVNPLSEIEKILAGRYTGGTAGKRPNDPPDEYHIKWKARFSSLPPFRSATFP